MATGARAEPRACGRRRARRAASPSWTASELDAGDGASRPPPRRRSSRPSRRRERRAPRTSEPQLAPEPSRRTARPSGGAERKKQRAQQRRRKHGQEAVSADGTARLGDDGHRDLALRGLRAGPLLGRHRRRLHRRDRGRGRDRPARPGLLGPRHRHTDIGTALVAVPEPRSASRSATASAFAPRSEAPTRSLASRG